MKLIGLGFFLLFVFLQSCKIKEVPTVYTTSVGGITSFTAACSGRIIDDGGAPTTAYGVCWSTNEHPTIADNMTTELHEPVEGAFLSYFDGLTANTNYFVRAYATNIEGTGYGEQIQITTLLDYTGQSGTINDIDGNTYSTIGIGCQIWMAENLKTTKYNDGTAITNVTTDQSWYTLNTGAYCEYDNNISNSEIYGRLYNWYVVASDNPRNVCPQGWHVPDWYELSILPDITDRNSNKGGKLKETGTIHWANPNAEATNETGFTALPGGHRDYTGTFKDIGNYGFWWSSTDYHQTMFQSAWFISLSSNNEVVSGGYGYNKREGFSVRCIRD